MDVVLNWLWQGGVVALVAGVMLRLLDRARAQVRCVVCWASLFIVLVLPILSLIRDAVFPVPALRFTPVAVPLVSVPAAGWWASATLVLAASALWVGIYGVRLAAAAVALWRAKRRSGSFPATVEATLRHWRRVSKHGRRARLVVSDDVRAAAVLWGRSPQIAVAPALLRHLSAGELDRVVIHEWAHVQRRDDLATFVQLVVRAIAGWHPAVWWIDRRLQLEREIACDEVAVALTGAAKSYASCLVKLATLPASPRAALPAPAALSSSGLSRRVERILSCNDFAAPRWSRGMAAVVVATLCGVAPAVGGFRIVERDASAAVETLPAPVRGGTRAPEGLATPGAIDRNDRLVAGVQTRRAASGPPRSRFVAAVEARAAEVAPARDREAGRPPGDVVELPAANAGADGDVELDRAAARDVAHVEWLPVIDTALDLQPPTRAPGAPWDAAAAAGVAIGRGTRDAGAATAGLFGRFGRRVASAF